MIGHCRLLRPKQILLLLGLLGLSLSAAGQGTGDFTVSFGYNYKGEPRKLPTFSDNQTGPAKFEVWLHPRFSLRVEDSSFKFKKVKGHARNTGTGDIVFGAALTLIDEKPQRNTPAFAIDYSAKIPVASKGLGSGEVDHQILGIISRSLTKRVYGEIDAGVYLTGMPSGSSAKTGLLSLITNIGLGQPRKGEFKLFLFEELDGATHSSAPASARDPAEVTSTTLIVRKLPRSISLSGGFVIGITPYASRFGVSLGIKYRGSFRSRCQN